MYVVQSGQVGKEKEKWKSEKGKAEGWIGETGETGWIVRHLIPFSFVVMGFSGFFEESWGVLYAARLPPHESRY